MIHFIWITFVFMVRNGKNKDVWQAKNNCFKSILIFPSKVKILDGRVKVLFDKQVYYDNRVQSFPSYLWLNLAGGIWKIEVESDEVTDANLC